MSERTADDLTDFVPECGKHVRGSSGMELNGRAFPDATALLTQEHLDRHQGGPLELQTFCFGLSVPIGGTPECWSEPPEEHRRTESSQYPVSIITSGLPAILCSQLELTDSAATERSPLNLNPSGAQLPAESQVCPQGKALLEGYLAEDSLSSLTTSGRVTTQGDVT
ncbi:hypothetical protein AOLI_G00301530 [Acnodon oligacanthus]